MKGYRGIERVTTTVAMYLGTWSIHGLPADPHSSTASSRLNWLPRRFKWTRPFLWKTKSGFCACAITFHTRSAFESPLLTCFGIKLMRSYTNRTYVALYVYSPPCLCIEHDSGRVTRWRGWLMHCATSRKVAGSILIDIILPVALWPRNRNISWWVKTAGDTDELITFICRLSWNPGASISWKPQDLSRPIFGSL